MPCILPVACFVGGLGLKLSTLDSMCGRFEVSGDDWSSRLVEMRLLLAATACATAGFVVNSLRFKLIESVFPPKKKQECFPQLSSLN